MEKEIKKPAIEVLFDNGALKALRIQRENFKKQEKDFLRGKGACAYILLVDMNNPSKWPYVGYTGNPAERITTHRSKKRGKDWWHDALIFVYNSVDEENQELHFDIADCAYLENFLYEVISYKDNDKKALKPYIKPNAQKMLENEIEPLILEILKKRCSKILKEKYLK